MLNCLFNRAWLMHSHLGMSLGRKKLAKSPTLRQDRAGRCPSESQTSILSAYPAKTTSRLKIRIHAHLVWMTGVPIFVGKAPVRRMVFPTILLSRQKSSAMILNLAQQKSHFLSLIDRWFSQWNVHLCKIFLANHPFSIVFSLKIWCHIALGTSVSRVRITSPLNLSPPRSAKA